MPSFIASPLHALKSSPGLLDGLFPSGAVPSDLPLTLQISHDDALVALGNTLPVGAVAAFPSTVGFVADPSEYYTLVLQDPDAPSAASPTSRSFLHLIKPNLQPLAPDALLSLASAGVDAENASIVNIPKEDLMPWRAPGPGKGSGKHRYVYLLLTQPSGKIDFPADHPLRNGAPEGRRHFNIEQFAAEELKGGQVVGANFFIVEAEP